MSMEERRTRASGSGWLATAGGALLLIALGFGVGIVAGTAYEEPELVADHLAGRSTEVVLAPNGSHAAEPDVAAPAPAAAQSEAGALGERQLEDAPEAGLDAPAAQTEPDAAPEPLPGLGRPQVAAREPAVRPAVAKPAAAGSFSIQVGAFSSEKAARELAGELGRQGYTTYLMDEGEGARWKVRVGPLRTRSEAEAVSARLKKEQRLPTWIQANGQG